jgi:hypothetical protein
MAERFGHLTDVKMPIFTRLRGHVTAASAKVTPCHLSSRLAKLADGGKEQLDLHSVLEGMYNGILCQSAWYFSRSYT